MLTPSRLTASLPVLPPPRPQVVGWRALVGAVAVLGVCLLGSPTPAAAAPCGPLLEQLYFSDFNYIKARWTTNYQAHGYWSTAHARTAFLGPYPGGNGPMLSGLFNREWHIDGHTEANVYMQFYLDGTVFFGPYGPYTAECYGDKFLVVNSWDSFEVFTFKESNSSCFPEVCNGRE